eukprot:TRINITY_DN954_c0_g1_i1.p1 TRINITY_DN954_c0_g1~~TRINITY_DN954_c0_g1_i1.p1  ORF type:complete len:313 (+),score=86.17 TRINITY_DN954_c0_g1_i1:120-941(+)
MTPDEKKAAQRRASRSLRKANKILDGVKRYLNGEDPIEEEDEDGEVIDEQQTEEEEDQMESVSLADDEEEGSEEAKPEINVRMVLRWWTRLLQEISFIFENHFDDAFLEIRDFMDRFQIEKKDLQHDLDAKFAQQEISKLLRRGESKLKRLNSALSRKNSKLVTSAKDNVQEICSVLQDLYPNDPAVQDFLVRSHRAILQTDAPTSGVEMKSVKKNDRARNLEQYKQAILQTRQDIDRTMSRLNSEIDSKTRRAQNNANHVTNSFQRDLADKK